MQWCFHLRDCFQQVRYGHISPQTVYSVADVFVCFACPNFLHYSFNHRIGWWENLQESPIFDGKKTMVYRFSLKPIHWIHYSFKDWVAEEELGRHVVAIRSRFGHSPDRWKCTEDQTWLHSWPLGFRWKLLRLLSRIDFLFTLWLFNIAMGNGPIYRWFTY